MSKKNKKKTLAWARVSRRSVTPRDLSNTGSPAGFPKTRGKKWEGLLRIKSAMLSLCLCECGPHSPIATVTATAVDTLIICSEIRAKSFGDGSQDICKYKESNLGQVAGF